MPLVQIMDCLLAMAEIREPLVPLWAMELAADVFLGTWLFFVGASVGSFLNVVVYRLPRGMNLIHPGSRCPSCLHPIRLRDNIPILSWLLLRGRCRDCQARFSSRYFWVELLIGSIFLGLWLLEASIYPYYATPNLDLGWRASPPPSAVAFWCAYVLHVGLIATLVAGALIHADGFRTPGQLFVPILLLGLALPIVWPEIRSVAAFPYEQPNHWQAALIDGIAGAAAGTFLALVGLMSWLTFGRSWPRFAPVALLASVGAIMGWQGMLVFTPAIVLLYLAASAMLWLLGPLLSLPEPSSAEYPAPSTNHHSQSATSDSPLPSIPANRDLSHEPNQPPV
jgi:leader peptidase (prepilin peptidase)/N-methyltransferase